MKAFVVFVCYLVYVSLSLDINQSEVTLRVSPNISATLKNISILRLSNISSADNDPSLQWCWIVSWSSSWWWSIVILPTWQFRILQMLEAVMCQVFAELKQTVGLLMWLDEILTTIQLLSPRSWAGLVLTIHDKRQTDQYAESFMSWKCYNSQQEN